MTPKEKVDKLVTDLANWLNVTTTAIRETPVQVIAALRPMLERDQRYKAYVDVTNLEDRCRDTLIPQ